VDASAGFDVAGNRTGDFSFVFIQAAGGARRLVAASYDRLPGSFSSSSSSKRWRNVYTTPLAWTSALDLWGPLTYTVVIDGKPVTTTQDTKAVLPPGSMSEGVHTWRVTATDRHGQGVTTIVKPLKVDTVAPTGTLSVKRKKRVVTVTVKANDVLPPSGQASGVREVAIDFGEGGGVIKIPSRKATYRFRHTGKHTIKVAITDRAGNIALVTRDVTIGGKK
jgi:hypothetical protein